MLVVTTDDLPGYEVRQVLGQVVGATARLLNPFLEGVRTLDRGDLNPRVTKHLARWRQEVINLMTEQARARGANAVLGMRFDHRDISEVWGEMCAYGTAVYAVPLAGSLPPPAADPERITATGRARPPRS
ncbi:MAG TPA: YbjQ family protein [Natronosporangium sp.]|nr:YbjQ family protein [Natronosporangium sp.]